SQTPGAAPAWLCAHLALRPPGPVLLFGPVCGAPAPIRRQGSRAEFGRGDFAPVADDHQCIWRGQGSRLGAQPRLFTLRRQAVAPIINGLFELGQGNRLVHADIVPEPGPIVRTCLAKGHYRNTPILRPDAIQRAVLSMENHHEYSRTRPERAPWPAPPGGDRRGVSHRAVRGGGGG